MMSQTFIDLDLPDHFVIEVLTSGGQWLVNGQAARSDFARQEDGTYVSAGDGSPFFLRAVRQDGQVVYALDGAADPFVYRLRPVPG